MLLISFAWCPKVRKLQIRVKRQTEFSELEEDVSFDSEDAELLDRQRLRMKTARQRITAITSLVKLCLTPAVGAACIYAFGLQVDGSKLKAGFENLGKHDLLRLFLINIICGYISQVLGRLGCTLGLQKICFALPLILSTPVSVVLVGAFDGCRLLNICLCNTTMKDGEILETVILAIVMWLAQIFSTTIYIWQSQEFLMAKESMLFWVPSYDGESLNQGVYFAGKRVSVFKLQCN